MPGRGSGKFSFPTAGTGAPQLVVWPQVAVMQRSLADYASLIEEVSR